MIIARFRLLVIATVLLIGGCQPTVYQLMPDPIADQRSDYDLTPVEEKKGTVVIGYVTNRVIDTEHPERAYAKDFDLDLRFGDAFIQMGDGEESWEQTE